jgi:predicted lipoprotein with Yx(FWY)xxD motif
MNARTRTAAGRRLLASAVLVLAVLVAAVTASAAATGTPIKIAKTSLGRVLVDGSGKTLYLFAADKRGASACSGPCAAYWPPLIAGTKAVAGAGVRASLLGTTMRAGGKLQVTYKGHPLYRFQLDAKPGQTNGEGMNGFGGLWWAVSPTGAAVKHGASTTATPTPPADGGYGSYGP